MPIAIGIYKAFSLLSVLFLSAGCTLLHKSYVTDIERRLISSGFKVEYATTDEMLDQLQTLEQHKLELVNSNGKTFYKFHDAQYCKCSYIGLREDYQNYLKLTEEEKQKEFEDDQYFQRWSIFSGRYCLQNHRTLSITDKSLSDFTQIAVS